MDQNYEEITDAERAELLRSLWKPTPPELISLLPRYKGKKETPKSERQREMCRECGVYHEVPALHLKFLGHSDTTRLIAEVDPMWQWEPKAGWDENGEPVMVRNHSGYPVRMWIMLTILGVTRPGVGTVTINKDDPEKELIGDALRNAALRFGIGADLWSKAHGGDSDDSSSTNTYQAAAPRQAPAPAPRQRPEAHLKVIAEWPSEEAFDQAHTTYGEAMAALSEEQRIEVKSWKTDHGIGWPLTPDQYEGLATYITVVQHDMAEDDSAPDEQPPAPCPVDNNRCSCGSSVADRWGQDGTPYCALCAPL